MGENLNNVRAKAVEVFLDTKRTFLFDLNAFAELEEEYGTIEHAMEVFNELTKKDSKLKKFPVIRRLVYLALMHEEENVIASEKEAGNLIDLSNMTYVMEKLTTALINALPKQEDQKKIKN